MLTVRHTLERVEGFLFDRLRDEYIHALRRELDGCESVLDVGCGPGSPLRHLAGTVPYSVGIDGYPPCIEASRAAGIHHEYFLMDIRDLSEKFGEGAFDGVVALDVLEHLEKGDGLRLIGSMEKVARKKVVIFTPNGFYRQSNHDGNPHQSHLSGWEADEMRGMGYRVTGINGWKRLRGEMAQVKGWPVQFWWRVSLLSQLFTTRHPEHAFAILCVKEKCAADR